MEYQVTWTATFSTTVVLKEGQTLSDAIQEINIPEDGDTAYKVGTFEVEKVLDGNDKQVKDKDWVKIVGTGEEDVD